MMDMSKRLIVCQFSFLMLAALAGCQPEFGDDFVRHSYSEQRRLILNYPLEQQVDLYLKVMRETHPPNMGLADIVASHGADIVPILRERLAAEDNGSEEQDFNKMNLFSVFWRMQAFGHFQVASHREIMTLLKQQAVLIQDPTWKGIADRDVGLIEEDAALRRERGYGIVPPADGRKGS